MGYFSYFAKQYFWTAPTGERLFCPGPPFKVMGIIPDEETEKRLFTKTLQLWHWNILPLLVINPFLFFFLPITSNAGWYIGYIVAFTAISTMYYRLLSWFMLQEEVKQLPPYAGVITPTNIQSNINNRYSWPQLIALLFVCLMFVVGGIWIVWVQPPKAHPIVGIGTILFFGFSTFNALRLIYWKLILKDNQ